MFGILWKQHAFGNTIVTRLGLILFVSLNSRHSILICFSSFHWVFVSFFLCFKDNCSMADWNIETLDPNVDSISKMRSIYRRTPWQRAILGVYAAFH